jgi:hypothetical protein
MADIRLAWYVEIMLVPHVSRPLRNVGFHDALALRVADTGWAARLR